MSVCPKDRTARLAQLPQILQVGVFDSFLPCGRRFENRDQPVLFEHDLWLCACVDDHREHMVFMNGTIIDLVDLRPDFSLVHGDDIFPLALLSVDALQTTREGKLEQTGNNLFGRLYQPAPDECLITHVFLFRQPFVPQISPLCWVMRCLAHHVWIPLSCSNYADESQAA